MKVNFLHKFLKFLFFFDAILNLIILEKNIIDKIMIKLFLILILKFKKYLKIFKIF